VLTAILFWGGAGGQQSSAAPLCSALRRQGSLMRLPAGGCRGTYPHATTDDDDVRSRIIRCWADYYHYGLDRGHKFWRTLCSWSWFQACACCSSNHAQKGFVLLQKFGEMRVQVGPCLCIWAPNLL